MAAKKELDSGRADDFDDFDGGFDDFNFDEPTDDKSRKPGSPIKRGVKEAFKDHITSPDVYRSYVGKVLPRQYGELWDDYTKITDVAKSTLDGVKKQVRQPINDLVKTLQRGVDKKHTKIHKFLDKARDSTESYSSGDNGKYAAEQRDAATKLAIEQVFDNYQQLQDESKAEERDANDQRFARQFIKLQSQEQLLGSIAKSVDHQVKFITGVEIPYKRKSLELQYRMAHGITDLVELTRALAEQQRKQLDIVVKNTALPDIQKQQLSESFKQGLRNKFVDKTLGAFGGKNGVGGLIDSIGKNIAEVASQTGEMLAAGVGMADMAAGSHFDNSPEQRKRNLARMAAGTVLGKVGPDAAGGLSKLLMRKAPNLTKKVFQGARKLGYYRDNAHSELLKYANGGGLGGKDDVLREVVGMMLPGRDTDKTINRASGAGLKEPTSYDQSSKRSLVEVIPGYLSRILQELQITRTGDTGIKPMMFNYSTSRFETLSKAKGDLKAVLSKNHQKDNIQDMLSMLEKNGSKLGEEDKSKLAKLLISGRRGGRMMTAGSLSNADFYKGATPEQAKTYSGAFGKLFDVDERGRFKGSKKGDRQREKFFSKLNKTDGDAVNAREIIQDLFDTGRAELAYELGLIDAKGEINLEAIYQSITDGTLPATGKESVQGNKAYANAAPFTSPGPQAQQTVRTRFVQRGTAAAPQPAQEEPKSSAREELAQKQYDILSKLFDLTQGFANTNHADLTAVLERIANMSVGTGEAPQPGGNPSFFQKTKNFFSSKFGGNNGAGPQEATQPPPKNKFKGYWKSTIGENAKHIGGNAWKSLKAVGTGLSATASFGANMFGKASDALARTRLFGARTFKDFKDGIPKIGDIYVQGEAQVRITAQMLRDGIVVIVKGKNKTIHSLTELADAAGDVFDTAGNVLLSQSEKLRTYVKANGEIFTRVWLERIRRGARRVKDVAFAVGIKAAQTGVVGFNIINSIRKAASGIGRELFMAPKDVYVKGDPEPRLTATLMRLGAYTNVSDKTVITQPTQINGAVYDADNNVVISLREFKRGLVDINGKPFKTMTERVAAGLRTNMGKTIKAVKAVGKGVFKTARTIGSGVKTMFTKGLSGFKGAATSEGGGTDDVSGSDSLSVLIQIRNILDSRLGSGAGSGKPKASKRAAAKAAKAAKGKGADTAPDTTDTPEMPETPTGPAKPSRLKSAMTSIGNKLGRLFGKGKAKLLGKKGDKVAEPAAGEPAQPKEVRVGSYEDLKSKYKNVNAYDKDKLVKTPEAAKRANVFDTIVGAIVSGFKMAGSLLLSVFSGAGLLGKAGTLLKGAGTAAGTVLKAGGSLLGKGVGLAGRGAGIAAKFGIKKLAVGAAGAVAGVAGSPVLATALAIGGAIWTAKEIYDYFKEKKNPVGKSDKRVLQILRLTEYGAPVKDFDARDKLVKIEDLCSDAVSIKQNKAELDENGVNGDDLLNLAGIARGDDVGVKNFLAWFNKRFTPVYLKWMTVAKANNTSLLGLEDLSDEQRTSVVNATANSDGWDEMTNPFGAESLVIGSTEIAYLRKVTLEHFKSKKKIAKDDGIKGPQSVDGKDGSKPGVPVAPASGAPTPANGQGVKPQLMPNAYQQPAKAGAQVVSFTSKAIKNTPVGTLTALQSIRVRMYGHTQPSMTDVYAIIHMEDYIASFLRTDNAGHCTFTGDTTEVWVNAAGFFGLNDADTQAQSRWLMWFNNRFLPVYTTYVGQMQYIAGVKTAVGLEEQLSKTKLYNLAQALVSVSGVWSITAMPLEKQVANTDINSVSEIMESLKAQADKEKANEANYKAPVQTKDQLSTQGKNSVDTPTRAYADREQLRTVSYAKTPAAAVGSSPAPDSEAEPKGKSSTPFGTKPQQGVGALIAAPGDLASGANGAQFVKAPSKQAIDGLNPEMRKLFLGMAEEYGNMTSQSIKVNRGFATRDEQAVEYNKNPNKAAKPGSSMHEYGLALDIDSVDANRLEKLGLMRKYGFTRPVGGETWHLEPAGIQHDIRGLRTKPTAASAAVAASVGKGGGGLGATRGTALATRDTQLALSTREGTSVMLKNNQFNAAGTARAANDGPASGVQTPADGTLYSKLSKSEAANDPKMLVQASAQAVGVDPKLAATTVAMESGFKTDAKASGKGQTATGLFQFTKGKWGDMMKKHAKEYGIPADTSPSDKHANAILGAQLLKTNMSNTDKTGVPSDGSGAYAMHLLGDAGAKRLGGLKDTDSVAGAFPSQAKENRPLFYNKDGSEKTKTEFMQGIRGKLNNAARDFGISDEAIVADTPAETSPRIFKTSYSPQSAAVQPAARAKPNFEVRSPERSAFMATAPATSETESQMVKAINSGNAIHEKQLDVQKSILVQVSLLVEMASKKAAAEAAQPKSTQVVASASEPVIQPSRAEKAIRQVSAPAYRVRSA